MNMHTIFRRLVGLAVAATIGLIGFSVYLHAQDVMPVERLRSATAIPGAPILALLAHRTPPAIARRIRAVVVNSIQRVALWRFPHVAEKGLKRLTPLIADQNTAASVIGVSGVVWVVAASLHSTPDMVLSSLGHPVRMRASAQRIQLQAAAAFRMAGFQLAARGRDHRTAVTSTYPQGFTAALPPRAFNHGQSREAVAYQIVQGASDAPRVAIQASTAPHEASVQMIRRDGLRLATRAVAFPLAIRRSPDRCQAPEYTSCQFKGHAHA